MADTLTFLFTDIEDSSRLWDRHPEPMRRALALHNEIVTTAVTDHDGTIVKDRGDGFLAVFGGAVDAVEAALQTQRGLSVAAWEQPVGALRVRVGMHTGTSEARHGDYFGPEVNRAARLEAAAHGGQVLVSEATRTLAQDAIPPDATLRDLGYHTLRGLARPERVYQLVAPGLPDEFPDIRTVDRGRSSFPTFVTSFVGRSEEVDSLTEQLRDGGTRVLTLLGPGGIGKTRLAVETAHRVGPEFPGGSAFTDLVSVADTDGIPLAIAQAIGAHPEGSVPVIDVVLSEISNPTLLVLDNFEHLIAGSPIVADLIGRCPDVTMLVTSRIPLRIRGELIHQMEPLGVESGNGSLPAAVDLFVARAAEHGVVIDPDGPDGEAVLSICRRLDGLPLAIELAAARVRLLSVTELDAKLADSLAAIGTGAADLPERQQTIQSTIDWSVEALTPDQQELFYRLSIFPSGASLQQIEEVAAAELDGDALELVSTLVDHSLVMVSSNLPGPTRYRQLTVLREYAAERLREADALDDTMGRLLDHYVESAPSNARAIQSDGALVPQLELDYPNMSAAMEWSLAAGRAEEMVQVVFGLWPLWFNGDRAAQSSAWVEQADQVLSSPEADWLQGFFAFQFGDLVRAAAHFERALEGFEEAGDSQGLATVMAFTGAVASDPVEGEAMLARAQSYFEEEGQLLGQFVTKIFTSVVAVATGDLERALELREELLPAAEAYGYETIVGWAHWNLATVLAGLGRIDDAVEHNTVAFRLLSADGYQEGIASAGQVEAVIAANRGELARAVVVHSGCLAIVDRLGIELWWEVDPLIEGAMASAREGLGDVEYERLFAEGAALGLDDLVELIDSGLSTEVIP